MLGRQRRLQLNKMCSTFWVAAPHAHEADVLSHHLCISAPNRPTPALKRFRVAYSFRGKSDPGGAVISRVSVSPLFVSGLHDIAVAVVVFCCAAVEGET